MADEPTEIELKFRLDPAKAEAVFDALATAKDGAGAHRRPTKTRALTALYYDTPGRALSRAGLALRVRREDDVWVQTLKSDQRADGSMGRGEWEAPVPGATPDLDLLKATPAARRLSKAKGLAQLFTVQVERKVRLVGDGGAEIEVSLDRGEVAAGGRTSPITEVEFELKSGSPAALLGFAARARKRHGLRLSFATKAARGMALLARTQPRAEPFRAPRLSAAMTSGGAFKAIARASLEQIVGNAERLAETPGPEVVHQMRVGARRLRSAISTFAKVVDDRRLAAIKAELRWLSGELDTARNLDVLLAGAYRRAARRKSDRMGLADLGRRLRIARTGAYARARSAAEGERFADLAMDALAWIECGPWTAPAARGADAREAPLGSFAARALEKRWKKIVRGGRRIETLSREDRHHLRIDAKKLRYAAEVFALISAHPKRAHRFIGQLRRLQDVLGELNDIATGEGLAHELVVAAGSGSETDWAAGRLIGEESAREAALLGSARTALKALKDAKPFWDRT